MTRPKEESPKHSYPKNYRIGDNFRKFNGLVFENTGAGGDPKDSPSEVKQNKKIDRDGLKKAKEAGDIIDFHLTSTRGRDKKDGNKWTIWVRKKNTDGFYASSKKDAKRWQGMKKAEKAKKKD